MATQTSENNKRIAKNAVFLYARMLLSIIVSLYTSRIVLQTLGVEDYGIYGVVGGVVSMFTFLNSAMSGATSRYLTFEMGKGNESRLKETFSTAFIIHIGIAVAIFIIAETVGLWILCNKMVIPEGRMLAAHVVYQCSVIGMFFTITQVPYSAVIVAHEKMDIYAYVELLNVGLKLAIVYALLVLNWDKLIIYSILMLLVSISISLIYRFYCNRHYNESHLSLALNKQIMKPMLNFSTWNMLAECGYAFRVHGSNIVLNMFFGTIVNAAGGIATTVQGILLGFVSNVVTAVRPQIIGNYSRGDLSRMNNLMLSSIRLNLFLVGVLTIPMYVDAPYVLKLWLGNVPTYCVDFCRLLLIAIFITSVSQIVTIGIHASGKLRQTSIVRNIIYILTPIIIYIVLKIKLQNPVIGYVIIVLSQMIVCLTDIYILHINIPQIKCLSIFVDYVKTFITAVIIVCGISVLNENRQTTFLTVCVNSIVEWVLLFIAFWAFVFERYEKDMIKSSLTTLLKKITKV